MKTTVTEEFDAQGKLIKRITVTEQDESDKIQMVPLTYTPIGPYGPVYPNEPGKTSPYAVPIGTQAYADSDLSFTTLTQH